MKQLFTAIALILFITVPMMAQTVQVPQVQVGTFVSSGTNLSNGAGDRQLTVAVTFPKPFAEKPSVIVGLTAIDAAGGVGTRINVAPDAITRDGFIVVIKTWADSKVFSVNGSWVAVAPATVKVKK